MKKGVIIFSVILLIFASLFTALFYDQILISILTKLVKGDPIKKADLIVALGGENFRKTEATALFRKGYAKKILFTGFEIEKEDYKRYGLKDGEFIYPVKYVFNTYEEAMFVKEVVNKYSFKSVIIVTAFYHSRRASYIFKKLLEKDGVEVIVVPVFYKNFNIEEWWKNRYLLKVVITEWLGLLYYNLEY